MHEYEYDSGILYKLLVTASINTGIIPNRNPGNTSNTTAPLFRLRGTVGDGQSVFLLVIVISFAEYIFILCSGLIL